jgi:ribosomal protein S16
MQMALETKIQKAIQENARVKLEDIIEESNMSGANISEEVRNFLNTTARTNFN